jgi:hypothetical protein
MLLTCVTFDSASYTLEIPWLLLLNQSLAEIRDTLYFKYGPAVKRAVPRPRF